MDDELIRLHAAEIKSLKMFEGTQFEVHIPLYGNAKYVIARIPGGFEIRYLGNVSTAYFVPASQIYSDLGHIPTKEPEEKREVVI